MWYVHLLFTPFIFALSLPTWLIMISRQKWIFIYIHTTSKKEGRELVVNGTKGTTWTVKTQVSKSIKEEWIEAEMYYASRGLFLQYTTQQLIVALLMIKACVNANWQTQDIIIIIFISLSCHLLDQSWVTSFSFMSTHWFKNYYFLQ